VPHSRRYPDHPFLAVSAAIMRNGQVLVARRARPPAEGLFTLPGGGVEAGETLKEAIMREVREEIALTIEPIALIGHRDVIVREEDGRIEHHFVILAFAARWVAGEPRPNEEIAEFRWVRPSELGMLATTEGLAEIVAAAFERLGDEG
jgi:8-oxo-dGTP diphosphatase